MHNPVFFCITLFDAAPHEHGRKKLEIVYFTSGIVVVRSGKYILNIWRAPTYVLFSSLASIRKHIGMPKEWKNSK